MRRLATLAAVAGLAGSAFLAAAPAQAYCPIPNSYAHPCASLVGDCVTVAVYTFLAPAPSNETCLHP